MKFPMVKTKHGNCPVCGEGLVEKQGYTKFLACPNNTDTDNHYTKNLEAPLRREFVYHDDYISMEEYLDMYCPEDYH